MTIFDHQLHRFVVITIYIPHT